MSYNVSEAGARKLLRAMYEDQSLEQPVFDSDFALYVINTISSWFNPSSYHSSVWIERWEEPKPIEEEAP